MCTDQVLLKYLMQVDKGVGIPSDMSTTMPMDHKDQCLPELMQSNSLAHSCLLGQPCNKRHKN
jgi:hypothetical protein